MVAELNFDNPTVVSLVTYGAVLVGKMLFLLLLTSIVRIMRKNWANPEDAKAFSNARSNEEAKRMTVRDEAVERVRRCVLNDMENIIPFLLLAPMYVLTGPAHDTAVLFFRIFVVSRFVHTITYLFGLQPFRGFAYGAGLFVNSVFVYQIIKNGKF
ncbi:microsomal glutathione S-transferase 1-like [Ptychodera flava]|uniref:microsomal glutathione S-transferase 1-like n=1 Tax=Ptychodera flava TaxID=63121 RepID=UPI00396AAAD1